MRRRSNALRGGLYWWTALAIAAMVAALGTGRPADPPKANPHKADAHRLYEKRDFSGASAALEKHLKKNPDDRDARMLLGLSVHQLGQNLEAEDIFQELIRRRPDDRQAYFYLGLAQFLQGKFVLAEASARNAIRLGAAKDRAEHLLGKIYEERNEIKKALEFYSSALRENADFAEAQVSVGQALLKLGQPGEAIGYLRKAAQIRPRMAEAHYELGRAYLAARQTKEAKESLAAAARLGHPGAGRLLARRLSDRFLRDAASAPAPAAIPPVRFRNVAAQAGVDFVLKNHPTPEKYLIETMAGGVAAFDYNNDGLVDIFFTNGAALPSLEKTPQDYHNRLYRNDGTMKFSEVTAPAGLQGAGYSIGAAAADYDNDGNIDLFVAGLPVNSLYRNLGDGRFENVTARAGIQSGEWSVAAGWFDYDNDGWLDLFVVSYLDWSPSKNIYCGNPGANSRTYCHPKFFKGTASRLYRNLGNGAFEDVSKKTGISGHVGKGMSVAFADYDTDGYMDIFVTNDAIPNFLFHHDGHGAFEERGLEAGPALTDSGNPVSSMGVDFRDYNNDLLPDLVFTALHGETFPLFRNQGGGFFSDATYPSRVGVLSANRTGWSVGFVDLNNDGWKDLFTANSHVIDNVEAFSDTEKYKQPNSVWLNQGDGAFADASAAAGAEFAIPQAHRGSAFADFNNDGKMDIVVSSLGGFAELWENVSPGPNHWVIFRLEGKKSNRDGIGARIRLGNRSNHMTTSVGYASSSHAGVHFGLGTEGKTVPAEILWPSGVRQVLKDWQLDRVNWIAEPVQP